jgi:outer membrane protein assembly factor BamB
MYSDYLVELTPAGKTVWEWRTWEHLDPEADGITEVQAPRTMWAQGNSVLELPDGDILASYRPTSIVIRISRKTGQILWKLGSPTVAGQHAPTMLGNGNILIFDNGVHRLDDSMPFSRVIEINPATNEIVWKYQESPVWNFFSPRMGNAQRLANGNTLVCESSFGRFFEITKDGTIVWEYVNPFFGKLSFAGPPTTEGNLVFRALRYSAEEIVRARSHGQSL